MTEEHNTAITSDADAARAVGASDALAAHRAVALIAAGDGSVEDGLSSIAQALKTVLGLSGARIHLLDRDEPGGALRVGADAGAHAAFVQDAPSLPLDIESAAARAVVRGDATWEGDAYGISGVEPESANGVGRWRSAVKAQASATLPLSVRGRTLGALTLEWPEPHDFREEERGHIEAMAAAVSIAVDSLTTHGAPQQIPAPAAAGARVAAFLVSPDGSVAPAGTGGAAETSLMRVSIASSEVPAGGDCAPFQDVFACDGGGMAIVLGLAGSPSEPERLASTVKHLLRGWLSRGIGPHDALSSLAAWAGGDTSEASWIAATLAVVDPAYRFLVRASAGPSFAVSLGNDQRVSVEVDEHPLLGGTGPLRAEEERTWLLLRGDRIGLRAADVLDAAGVEPGRLGSVLSDARADASRLLDAGAERGSCCDAAALLEVLRAPGAETS